MMPVPYVCLFSNIASFSQVPLITEGPFDKTTHKMKKLGLMMREKKILQPRLRHTTLSMNSRDEELLAGPSN